MAEDLENAGMEDLRWPTVDGPLGAHPEQALKQARLFFYGGFFFLPWLWFMNCFYFSPALRQPSQSSLRPYVLWSGVGSVVYTVLLATWALTYAIGGEAVFGRELWEKLAVYNIAEQLQLFIN